MTREGSALPKTYLTLNKPLFSGCEPLDIAVYFRGHLTVQKKKPLLWSDLF